MIPFRQRTTLEERKRQCAEVTTRRPTYTPIVVEPGDGAPMIDKDKFLAREELTVSQFTFVLRRRLRMETSQALFLLVDRKLVSGDTTLRSVHRRSTPSDDGFLYITYTFENAFG